MDRSTLLGNSGAVNAPHLSLPRLPPKYWAILIALSALVFGEFVWAQSPPATAAPPSTENSARRELIDTLFKWIEATNARDYEAQSDFYPEIMDAFYLQRRVSR